ncbi:MAG: mannitol dehydrogenase family protein, partial [Mesorhizobium sp.]
MTVKLSSSILAKLPPEVAGPKYDRAALKAGIVHFGVGNFHRSHQAVYLDDLF